MGVFDILLHPMFACQPFHFCLSITGLTMIPFQVRWPSPSCISLKLKFKVCIQNFPPADCSVFAVHGGHF